MGILERAKDLISRLERQQTVNSQEYGQIYKELTGKNWKYTNCGPCIKEFNYEMKKKISEIEKNGGCLGCKKQTDNNDTNSNTINNDSSNSDKTIEEPIKEIVEQLEEMNVSKIEIQEIVDGIEISDSLIPKTKKVIKKKK